ncbi:MAG: HAMP domain-containing protein [Gemmatimonadaceae bacterium]|nr:HAMP domain-containing protein [Gemmatimonadaceae bacterium]
MKLFRTLGSKLTVAVGLIALVTIAVFALFNSRSDNRALLAEVERHANQLSEAVKSSTEFDMLLNQRERIHETVRRIGQDPSIQRIRIINKAGDVIYSSDSAEIGKSLDKSAEACTLCHQAGQPLERVEIADRTRVYRVHPDSGRTLGIINPIYNTRTCSSASCHAHPASQKVLGVLDVTLPLAEIDKAIQRGQLEVVLLAVVAFITLSVVIGLLVRRWVTLPVRRLAEGTRHVAGGDLNYVIPEERDDELGMLARSFNNMTQRLSEARLQLVQSDKLASLGRLAAGVAHEINNPLTGVLTYSSFLQKRTKDQPDVQEDLKVIVRETIRCREIVKSLLDFARQSVPKKSQAAVNEIITRAAAVVENQLQLNHVKLVQQLGAEVPLVTVDANQMQQVFINLFVNASDAIGPDAGGGTITVATSRLKLSPIGITQIKKAQCPKRHSLINTEVRIDNKPSIRVRARSEGSEGFIYRDPMYGMARHQFGIAPEPGMHVEVTCPECSAALNVHGQLCPECGAATFQFEVPGKGFVEGCTNRACTWQRWAHLEKGGDKDFVEIRVHDTGSGIPRDEIPRIFEPFYSTKGQKGNGLGLAVIWGIIDNHNGSISVESEVGVGTTFVIRIPVEP